MLLLLESLAFVLLWAGLAWIWLNYAQLPEQVPIHFGFRGEPDGWGRRAMIWLLPAVGFAIYLGLTLILLGPAPAAVRLFMAILKVELLATFLYIEWGQVQVATGKADRLGNGIWLCVAVVMVTSLLAPVLLQGWR